MPVDADGPPTPKAMADELERLSPDSFTLLRYFARHGAAIVAALRENERLRAFRSEVRAWANDHLSAQARKTFHLFCAGPRTAGEEADPASHEATKGDEDE